MSDYLEPDHQEGKAVSQNRTGLTKDTQQLLHLYLFVLLLLLLSLLAPFSLSLTLFRFLLLLLSLFLFLFLSPLSFAQLALA